MLVLSYVAKYRPQVIVGIGQGGVIASLLGRPLLVERAVRARVATARELVDIRRAWASVVALIACNPVVLPQRTDYAELLRAVPEMHMLQPRGILQILVLEEGTARPKARFAEGLAVHKPLDEAFAEDEKKAPRSMIVTPRLLQKAWEIGRAHV